MYRWKPTSGTLVAAALLLAGLLVPQTGWAKNLLFLPGDAYFSSALNPDILQQSREADEERLKLKYVRLERGKAYCGYAGYWHLRVEGVDGEMLDTLETVHRNIQGVENEEDDGPTPTIRGPRRRKGYPMLVYNRAFDFRDREFGRRYNEYIQMEVVTAHCEALADPDKPDECPTVPEARQAYREAGGQVPPPPEDDDSDRHNWRPEQYDFEVESKEAAEAVDPLDHVGSYPSIANLMGSKKPVSVRAEDVQFVIFESWGPVRGRDVSHVEFWVVGDEVRHFELREGQVRELSPE